jgi:hypothetical protein
VESINLEDSLWGVTDFNSLQNLTPHFEEASLQRTWDKQVDGSGTKTKIELRHIKNGVIVSEDGNETYYQVADQATRKVLPMLQGILADWQREKEKGKVTMVFEFLKD